jgi:hypothetical protein
VEGGKLDSRKYSRKNEVLFYKYRIYVHMLTVELGKIRVSSQ